MMSEDDPRKPICYEDVGLMFVMPPLRVVTAEEADRLRHEFDRTKIQEILDGAE